MGFRLEHLIPDPLLEQDHSHSGIWDRDKCFFEQDRIYVVEAPSGKGKTSLLSVMYVLRKDYSGKVFLDERDISGFSSGQWARLRKTGIAFIFQGLELFGDLSAMENILLKNRITRHKSQEQIRTLAASLGMESFLEKKTAILSFGQQQRVAIIRALCQPFRYLFADECFSHMDRENSRIAMALIREECRDQGAGLILTSLGNSLDPGPHEHLIL